MNKYNCDFLIAGGGIVGLCIAFQLIERGISNDIIIFDKEPELGLHSSGRNSGVLHAGIYYEPKSLKAKVCIEGAKRLKNFIFERKIKINKCGKLIIPQKLELDSQLDKLFERGKKNGANIEFVNSFEINKLASYVNITSGRGLWSPDTSVVNALEVIKKLKLELEEKGVKIINSCKNWELNKSKKELIINNDTNVGFLHFVNSAGLHSDEVAHKFDVGLDYKIIPFKGIYWKLKERSPFDININIYPVPDLNIPFLGVHFTPNVSKNIINIGPTAIPALGRENYKIFENIQIFNALKDFKFLANQYYINKDGFRKYVNEQAFLGFPLLFLRSAQELIPGLKYFHIERSDKVGLRAQLFNLKKNQIINDFLCLKGENSTHIINSISPAFTASFSFADFVIDNYLLYSLS